VGKKERQRSPKASLLINVKRCYEKKKKPDKGGGQQGKRQLGVKKRKNTEATTGEQGEGGSAATGTR